MNKYISSIAYFEQPELNFSACLWVDFQMQKYLLNWFILKNVCYVEQ